MSDPTGFDVRAYMRDPLQVRPTDLDLPALGDLDPATLEALTHLEAAERALLHRMRDFLVTPTHAESRVTAFLTTWAYEQHWLVQTLGAVLAANGRAAGQDRATALGRLRRARDERLGPVLGAIASNLLGAETTAAQMLTSRLDTAVLAESYRRLGAAEPRLAATTGAVVRLKERHLAFFTAEARTRLAAGPGARRLARIAVSRWQWPGTRYTARRTRTRPAADPEVRAALLGLHPELGLGLHPERAAGAAARRGPYGTRSVRTALARITRG
ncbi:hypothetical protein [Kocuria sp. SM24M-10]|uniref:hypothetical protein n=1 Tax=Kocuria sp. SM24M-10 TaxID=1660349 RepID=UPI000649EA11|nr:hypothetical protein [Kocuria sp. SM24M-10]KLU09450.1 hypothetical protein ABL57_12575 [Kocuria sp. SM24M-10]